ncbi:MAG: S1-like domain-containing RNA-binding protein [Candidatus Pseudobacter hemicellulosilyticus]|uniref:S1-like domain-containing RNA-binding protein n=1 Tax=Candidatus Pseudobacter hemicellulosilyticus TaxID=3121375 RepID=A0AAJ6BH49_9BACT|nr:MAG: S1-like domain-containing RNA-binding protein [Pseudobacter sp.]
MIEAGQYYNLRVVKQVEFGLYLDGAGEEILLPKRFVPRGAREGDELRVFIYHDSENRLIATTQQPKGVVGEIVLLNCVSTTRQGAFLDWGLMKDLFLPKSQQLSLAYAGEPYLVMIYMDEQTGRVAATEKVNRFLSNEQLTVAEKEPVDLVVQRESDLGYVVIINNRHIGLLHFSDVFRELKTGEQLKGFVKAILPENKIDVGFGEAGYKKVASEEDKILQLLEEHNGYLPYHDKSSPEEIYKVFGISKKTFKMALGALYKQRKIELTKTGFKAADS